MEAKLLCFNIILILLHFSRTVYSDDCMYTIYVKTGSVDSAGTDADVGVIFYDDRGGTFTVVPDLSRWGGIMGTGHNYYERGNLDIFRGRGQCLSGSICKMFLFHDNSGKKPGWYVEYVEVNMYGLQDPPHYLQKRFDVNEWLATDEPPNYATKTTKGRCPSDHPTILRGIA